MAIIESQLIKRVQVVVVLGGGGGVNMEKYRLCIAFSFLPFVYTPRQKGDKTIPGRALHGQQCTDA